MVQVCFRCPEDFRTELKIEAARRKTTVDELANTAIRRFLSVPSNANSLAAEEERLIDAWRAASPEGKKRILGAVYKPDEPVDLSLELKAVHVPKRNTQKLMQRRRKNTG